MITDAATCALLSGPIIVLVDNITHRCTVENSCTLFASFFGICSLPNQQHIAAIMTYQPRHQPTDVMVRQLRGERTSRIERLSIQIFGPAVKKKRHTGEVKEKHSLLHQQLLLMWLTANPSGLNNGANEASSGRLQCSFIQAFSFPAAISVNGLSVFSNECSKLNKNALQDDTH